MNKIKYLILLSLVCVLIPTVNAEWYNGTIEYNMSLEKSTSLTYTTSGWAFNPTTTDWTIFYKSMETTGLITEILYEDLYIEKEASVQWDDIPITVGGYVEILDQTGVPYGEAMMFIHKKTSPKVDIRIIIDEWNYHSDAYGFKFKIYSDVIDNWYDKVKGGTAGTTYSLLDINVLPFYNPNQHNQGLNSLSGYPATVKTYSTNQFKNEYNIEIDTYTSIYLTKDYPGYTGTTLSKFFIKDGDDNLIYTDSAATNTNKTIYVSNGEYDFILNVDQDDTNHTILSTLPIPTTDPSLTSDKEQYEYNEDIEFTYYNLDKITSAINSYDLITYCEDGKDGYRSLSGLHLSGGYNQYNGNTWFSTVNYPYGTIYYGVIDNELDYVNNKRIIDSNIKLSGEIFLLPIGSTPFISVNGDYSYINGDTIYYSYYTDVETNITIEDYSGTIIYKEVRVNGTGSNEYTIIKDNDKVYTYPLWSINMSSYNDNFTVYWSEIDDIPYNPDYIPDTNTTIKNEIENLKEGISPIKELIFGMSTIFLDNPDYDSNGIVDTDEMSNWLNSIVAIIIVIILYVFYKGLKRK